MHDPLDDLIAVWQLPDGPPLSREAAREISSNLVGFFQLLADWAAQDAARSPRPTSS